MHQGVRICQCRMGWHAICQGHVPEGIQDDSTINE